jgi:hypothetical protein
MKLTARLSMVMLANLLIFSNAWATPAQILIIRHAEKPLTGPNLSPEGEARANALIGFFQKDPRMLQYGLPVAIYAASPTKEDGSLRSIETVEPLAKALNLPIHEEFNKDEYADAAAEILNDVEYEGRMVLLSWEHKVIPSLAEALGIENAPQWPSNTFDRVWEIDYRLNEVSGFRNLPQRLMPGDSDH